MSAHSLMAAARLFLALALLTSTAASAKEPSCFPEKCLPENIQELFRKYMAQIPSVQFVTLEVRCTHTDCVAAFVSSDEESAMGSELLLPLYAKGWNIVSVGTAGSFDAATGERKQYVTISSRSGGRFYRPL